jgi:hypothetical protein
MIEADLVEETKRLQADGRSQRAIAAAIGKPRHWVRFTALTDKHEGRRRALTLEPQQRPELIAKQRVRARGAILDPSHNAAPPP